MSRPFRLTRPALLLLVGAVLPFASARSQAAPSAARLPERAVRRDIPITNAIRRALAAGTRDSTGRPGRAYWQLRTDYRIDVSLDPSTQRLTGTARITICLLYTSDAADE